ncbi:head-to-tail stopper [Microbacterium phage BAjuniper]|nr:head-to-tail stopper [Microbacterium phage BAjuniper]
MLPSFMDREYVRARPAMIEDHGTMVQDPDGARDRLTFTGIAQPGTGTEDSINRNGAEVVKTIWATDPNVDVHDNDIIELPDGDYFVNGEPERWDVGIQDHAVIRLSRWRG